MLVLYSECNFASMRKYLTAVTFSICQSETAERLNLK